MATETQQQTTGRDLQGLTDEQLLEMYRTMVTARRVEAGRAARELRRAAASHPYGPGVAVVPTAPL